MCVFYILAVNVEFEGVLWQKERETLSVCVNDVVFAFRRGCFSHLVEFQVIHPKG